jgi:hypothetical protein
LVIQFAIGGSDEGTEIVHNFEHELTFHPTLNVASEETQSARTPVGHYHEEENDTSRDQPSLSSKRSRQSKILRNRRLASYTQQDYETYAPSGYLNSIASNKCFHFEFEEPPMHRSFKLKAVSPGDPKPCSCFLSSARHKKKLSDKLDEVLNPSTVRGASGSNFTTRSGATEVTVATSQSTSSVGSRASSNGMRVLDLIQPFDRQELDRGPSDSASFATPLSAPPMLKQDISCESSALPLPPPLSHFSKQHSQSSCFHPDESIGMLDTSLETYYNNRDGQFYYYEE